MLELLGVASLTPRLFLGFVLMFCEAMSRRLLMLSRFTVTALPGWFRVAFNRVSVRPWTLFVLLLHGHKIIFLVIE